LEILEGSLIRILVRAPAKILIESLLRNPIKSLVKNLIRILAKIRASPMRYPAGLICPIIYKISEELKE
jgi:hypothetical protein